LLPGDGEVRDSLCIPDRENYLLGEAQGKEISGFSPASTKLFQDWSREEYKNDIGAFERGVGTDFKSFDEVRASCSWTPGGKQMPRWVAFRYFMRSRVWSEVFLAWTELIRKNIGADQLRTGTNGHDHHDFSATATP